MARIVAEDYDPNAATLAKAQERLRELTEHEA